MGNQIVVQKGLDETLTIGQIMADSGFFSDSKQQTQAIVKILAGQEMGIGPVAAMTGISVIKGKVSIGANLMANAIKAHPKYDYRVRKMENTIVILEFFENGESLGFSQFTVEDARAAGTQNMSKFPRNMLFARAISNGIKWYCPDALNGNTAYTQDELQPTQQQQQQQQQQDFVIEQPNIVIEQPKYPTRENLLKWLENLNQLPEVNGYFKDPKHVQNAIRLEWPVLSDKQAWAELKQLAINHADFGNYKKRLKDMDLPEDTKHSLLELFGQDSDTAWEALNNMGE